MGPFRPRWRTELDRKHNYLDPTGLNWTGGHRVRFPLALPIPLSLTGNGADGTDAQGTRRKARQRFPEGLYAKNGGRPQSQTFLRTGRRFTEVIPQLGIPASYGVQMV